MSAVVRSELRQLLNEMINSNISAGQWANLELIPTQWLKLTWGRRSLQVKRQLSIQSSLPLVFPQCL